MGLFDIFKKKGDDKPAAEAAEPRGAAPDAGGSPWPKKFKGFSDWEDGRKKAVGKEFLEDMGALLDNPKVKEVLDEDELELRGRYDDVPVRVQYEADMGWVSLEAKCASPIEDIALEWDPEKVPVHADDDDDDDWDDDDEVRVFVGKEVFIEGWKDSVNSSLTQFASLPAELQAEIVETMRQQRLTRFGMYSTTISLGYQDNAYEMADPAEAIGAGVRLMAKVARETGSGQVVVGQTASAGGAVVIGPINLVTCKYCHSKFNLGANPRCPNCGAPFDG